VHVAEAGYKLNLPPLTFVRVHQAELRRFAAALALRAGLDGERAELLAELLTANDLRGVFSHGTRQLAGYARALRAGELNPAPRVTVLREGPASLVLDGDGGLGYFPAYEGTLRAIEKAKALGVAVLQTRNHGHIGAAGIYSRLPLEHDLVAFVTSGAELDLQPGQPVYTPAIGSPISFSAPTGTEAPLVVDFSPVYDLRISPRWPELAAWVPGTIFRCIGLGTIAQAWGGILAGTPAAGARSRPRRYRGAGQSALVLMFRIGLFIEPAEFRDQMDVLARQLKELAPLDGFERASYAGDIERQREREFRRQGIPVGPEHRQELESIAQECGIDVPWRQGEPAGGT
jgi:LDH2 family malate/lactate/ureidoglycolate dehydrogenase